MSKHKVGGYDEPIAKPKRARLQVQPLHLVVEIARPKAPLAVQPACPELAAARLPPVKPLVAREEITPLAQQIVNLQVQAPVVPVTTIPNKPKGRALSAETWPLHNMPQLWTSLQAPPAQYPVVVLAKDPCTPAQYNGLVATQQKGATASKGKGKAMPSDDESDYEEEELEQEHDLEQGETPHKKLQQVVQNKCIAKKKANIATAHTAQVKKAVNNFLGQIPNGLGVKIWGLLDVEQMNLCFQGALGDCTYYSATLNAVLVGVDTNHTAAFEFTSGKHAALPSSIVYKHALRGLPCTPYELKKFFNYYKNVHILCCNHIVVSMLLGKLQSFAERNNKSLLNQSMKLMPTNPQY
ncbi:hypothetical protein C0993_006825 [Termitomyces sp. T159_Od127]|nr:hypothetical protein C0993_006825 [Termitomyces sp. T159_Od127]